MEPAQRRHPGHHVVLGDAERVLERPRRPGRHDVVVVLQPRPRRGRRRRAAALDQVHDEHRVHRALDGDAAGLALALAGVPVAERQQRARHVDAEVAGGPRAHLRGVHVPAERVGHQRGAHLAACAGATPTVPCIGDIGRSAVKSDFARGEPAQLLVPVELPDPHDFLERLVEQRGQVRPGQRAEQRHRGRRRPVARGRSWTRSAPRRCRPARPPRSRTARSAG